MRHYCTYFDSRYLTRALSMIDSMREHAAPFELWALALDRATEEVLGKLQLPEVRIVSLTQLEQAERDLIDVKPTRSLVEYYFTLTPCLPSWILSVDNSPDIITYLDADLFFFANPESIFAELGAGTAAIMPHRWCRRLEGMLKYGFHNVSWMSFANTPDGRCCLAWYRRQCLDWCYERVEKDRFADQKYLDRLPEIFPGVVSVQNRGANVASWNIEDAPVVVRDGAPYVGNDRLIFFHFHSHTFPGPTSDRYGLSLSRQALESFPPLLQVCEAYLTAVARNARIVDSLGVTVAQDCLRGERAPESTSNLLTSI